MNENEKKVQNQGEEHNQAGPTWGPAQWAECRHDVGNTDSGHGSDAQMPHMMAGCFGGCRYLLLLAVIVGIIFLTLGHYWVWPTIGICWMMPAMMMAAMALFGAFALRRMAMGHGFSGCCGASHRRHA